LLTRGASFFTLTNCIRREPVRKQSPRFHHLKPSFLWIQQCDVSPLFAAYPRLEHFCVRGADGLSFGALRHDRLKSLIIQSGGLGANVVREVAADAPELEHLELWLGDENYGAAIGSRWDGCAHRIAGQGFRCREGVDRRRRRFS
jgi:hypothetical protein